MIAAAVCAVVAGVAFIRAGWGGRRGAAPLGWALAAVALALLTARDGAWGLAIGVTAGIAAALALVLHAGWTSPARTRRPVREAPSVAIPRRAADIAGRVAVFVLVVPVAFVAAEWLAFGAQALARGRGAVEADATVLTLFLQPLAWSGLMAWQMTRSRPSRMIAAPVVAAAAGTVLWGLA